MRMSPIDQPLMVMELLGHGFARQQLADRHKAQASKIQAADQLFDRAAHLAGQVLEDLQQGASPQGLGPESWGAAAGRRNPHRASSSCLT
jgi:hypothetical protein